MSYRITERPGLIKPPGLHPRCCNPLQHASRRTFKRTTDRAELHLTPLVDLLLVLVVFLLQGFSPSGELLCPCKRLQLPEGIHYRDLEAAPIVRITMDTVSLNGQPEAEMSELLRALGTQEPLAKLFDDLVALKNIYRLVHPQPRSWQATILIEADKNLSFGVLRKVSSTCAAAGYGNVQFVVEQKA